MLYYSERYLSITIDRLTKTSTKGIKIEDMRRKSSTKRGNKT
jgi:hypothetical protein